MEIDSNCFVAANTPTIIADLLKLVEQLDAEDVSFQPLTSKA